MPLSGGKFFFIKPTATTQLILGTNGSGKSSLVKELSPLPGEKDDFTKDGSKTTVFSYRGNTYRLVSTFANGTKHEFWVNEEENLNEGGTTRVQLELVRQHFGYTPEIHALRVGETKFTTMSPAKRREWFTTLSDVRYDYAIATFNKLQEIARDARGTVKELQRRLTQEQITIITKEDEDRLRGEIDELHKELSFLMEQRSPVDKDVAQLEQQQEKFMRDGQDLANRILRARIDVPLGTCYTDMADVENEINRLQIEAAGLETTLNIKSEEFNKLMENLNAVRSAGVEGFNNLQQVVRDLRAKSKELLDSRRLKIEIAHPRQGLSAFNAVYDQLVEVFTTIPENKERVYSNANLSAYRERVLALTDTHKNTTGRLRTLVAKKDSLDEHKKHGPIACPECGHSWIQNFTQGVYDAIVLEIGDLEKDVAKQASELESLQTKIGEILEYMKEYRVYASLTANQALKPFWDYLNQGQFVFDSPRYVLTIMEQFRGDLVIEEQAAMIEDQINEKRVVIETMSKMENSNIEELTSRKDELEDVIGRTTANLIKARASLSEHQNYRRQVNELKTLSETVKQLLGQAGSATLEIAEQTRRKVLNDYIRSLQSRLAAKNDCLDQVSIKQALIQDIQHQIGIVQTRENAAKMMANELSPKEGLIAEGLMGFINNFTNQMNGIIRKIWSYPLIIKPCAISDTGGAELDYKFPMMVLDQNTVISDVSKGSSGMQEIVDLSFVIVSMRYLQMQDFPLILDEFGRTFDEAHRNAAMHAVKSFLEQLPFSQMFMVSHYADAYGSLTNAEICVLSDTNITIPVGKSYNDHVRIQ